MHQILHDLQHRTYLMSHYPLPRNPLISIAGMRVSLFLCEARSVCMSVCLLSRLACQMQAGSATYARVSRSTPSLRSLVVAAAAADSPQQTCVVVSRSASQCRHAGASVDQDAFGYADTCPGVVQSEYKAVGDCGAP